jgi:hypothetical protein
VQEIEKEYPRGKFATEGGEVLEREFLEKPNCLLSHFHGGVSNFSFFIEFKINNSCIKGDEFIKVVRVEPIVPVDD